MRNKSKKLIAIMAAMMIAGSTVAATATVASAASITAEAGVTVYFKSAGAPVATQAFAKGQDFTIIKPADPAERAGYVFKGWQKVVNGTATGDVIKTSAQWVTENATYSTAPTADVTYEAVWEAVTATAIKNAYVSDVSTGTVTLEFNQALALGNYHIDLEYNGNTYLVKATVSSANTTSLTAKITDAAFRNGETTTGIALPTPAINETVKATVYKQSYTGTSVAYATITNDRTKVGDTVTATVPSAAFVVTFDANGGKFAATATTKTTVNLAAGTVLDSTVAGVTAPVLDAYEFVGWYTDKECTKKYEDGTKLTSNITLYAKYKSEVAPVNVEEVTYTATNKTINVNFDGKLGNKQYLIQATVGNKTYSVYTNANGTDQKDATSASISLAAGSTMNFINKDNAKTTSENNKLDPAQAPVIENGTKITVTVSTFETLDEDGVTKKAPASYGEMTKIVAVATKELTVKENYAVKFDTQGGSAIADYVVAPAGTAKKPTDPTKADNEFQGWYTDATFSKKYDFNTKVTGDITLYAGWKSTATAPAAPTNVTVATVTDTTAKIKFAAVEGATGYEIYNGENKVATVTTQNGATTISKTVTGLKADTAYNLTVKAIKTVTDMDGTRDLASEASAAVTATTKLAAPANLKAVKKTTTSLKLQFAAVEGADGYRIYDANGKAIANVSTQNGATTLTKTVKGLKKNTTYKFKVRAYKDTDNGRAFGAFSNVYTKATAAK